MDDNELEAQRLHDQRRNELDAAKAPLEAEIFKLKTENVQASVRYADAVNLAINREAEIKRLRSGIEELIVDLKTKWEPQTTAMLAAQYGIVGRLESLLNPPTTGGTE